MCTARTGPSLLLVENEEGLRRVIEDALEDAGFSVVSAATGLEAFGQLEKGRTFVALVTDVDDLRPHEVDGWELARRARQINPDVAVVYTSGSAGADWASEGVPKSTFLQKPFALAQLITAVSTDLNRGS